MAGRSGIAGRVVTLGRGTTPGRVVEPAVKPVLGRVIVGVPPIGPMEMVGPPPAGRGRTAVVAPAEVVGREIIGAAPAIDGRVTVGREIVAGRGGT